MVRPLAAETEGQTCLMKIDSAASSRQHSSLAHPSLIILATSAYLLVKERIVSASFLKYFFRNAEDNVNVKCFLAVFFFVMTDDEMATE